MMILASLLSIALSSPLQDGETNQQDTVDLDFNNASIPSVFRMLGRKHGLSVVVSPEVQGTVTAHIQGGPLEDALSSLASASGVNLRRRGNILEVLPAGSIVENLLDAEATSANGVIEPLPEVIMPPPLPMLTEVYPLSFVTTAEVLPIIQALAGEKAALGSESARTIVVTTSEEIHENVSRVILALDKPQRQVRIEAKLIETTLGETERLGINWNLRVQARGSARPMTFPFDRRYNNGTLFPENNPGTSDDEGSESEFPPDGSFPFANAEDFVFGTLNFIEFGVLLEALQENSESKLVASPSITATENRNSRIHVGEVVPIPQFVRNEQFGTTSTTGYDDIEIGTSLNVIARINRDDSITLQIVPEVSAIIGFTGPNKEYPIRTKREAETEVTLLPGRTLVIGGLVSEQTLKITSKVPILGDIPFLGELFTHRDEDVSQTDLLIFITPRLVDITGDEMRSDGLSQIGDHWLPTSEAEEAKRLVGEMASRDKSIQLAALRKALNPDHRVAHESLGLPDVCARIFRENASHDVSRATALRVLATRWPAQFRTELQSIVDRRNVDALESMAQVACVEESLLIRGDIISAMRATSPGTTGRLFRESLSSPQVIERRGAIECLQLIDDPSSQSSILALVDDKDLLTRSRAIQASESFQTVNASVSSDRKAHIGSWIPDHWEAAKDVSEKTPLIAELGENSTPWHQGRVDASLELLARLDPNHADFVQKELALNSFVLKSGGTHVSRSSGVLYLDPDDVSTWSSFDLAHQLVHYSVHMRLRRLGEDFEGPFAERFAYREQFIAVRRLAGDLFPERGDWNGFLSALEGKHALDSSPDVR